MFVICKLTGKTTLDRQSHRQDGHEHLVCHRVDDRADNGAQVPFASYPSVQEVGNTGIGKQPERPGMMVVENTIADEGCSNKPGCSQKVRNGVDVLSGGNRECPLQHVS